MNLLAMAELSMPRAIRRVAPHFISHHDDQQRPEKRNDTSMKRLMMTLAIAGVVSVPALAESGSAETTVAETTTAAPEAELPCGWCCPPHICGMNGPSFDGTTVPTERTTP